MDKAITMKHYDEQTDAFYHVLELATLPRQVGTVTIYAPYDEYEGSYKRLEVNITAEDIKKMYAKIIELEQR